MQEFGDSETDTACGAGHDGDLVFDFSRDFIVCHAICLLAVAKDAFRCF